MSTLRLDIEGAISEWGYSKSYVRNFLNAAGKGPVTIGINSRGGDVNQALGIHELFTAHGDVTVHLTGFNASAATLISLGAKQIKMNSNSFYLIHKALAWVNTWGNMNPDDIDATIAELEKQKLFLEKLTLELAKMYSAKSGKTSTEILSLMKDEVWLTAKEALDWGFVDEIVQPAVDENLLKNQTLIDALNYAELPIPASMEQTEDPTPGIIASVTKSVKTFINTISNMKQFSFLNTLLAVPSLEATEEGIYLNEQQAQAIDTALEANAQLVAARDQAIVDRDFAVNEAGAAIVLLDAIDPTVAAATTNEAKIQAIATLIAKKPATTPVGVMTAADPTPAGETEAEKILNSLPHMQEE